MPSRRFLLVGAWFGVAFGLVIADIQALEPRLTPSESLPAPPPETPAYGSPTTYPSTATPDADPVVGLPAPAPLAKPDAASDPNSVNSSSLPPFYKPYGSPEAMTAAMSGPADGSVEQMMSQGPWCWQALPTGLMYPSYLAGNKEPRISSQLVHERNHGWYWDATVGARVGILRYGTDSAINPQGWQLDVEGAGFPRLDLEHNEDLVAADFRGGMVLTTRQGAFATKFGYYHLSSHIGDEYLLNHRGFDRLNYVRESLIGGIAVYPHPDVRLYSEAGWCFHTDGGAEPWEFQFGVEWNSAEPTGPSGSPFLAVNGHLRQENDFGGNLTVQTGWQWRGRSSHLFRIGMQYVNGMSDQYQFYRSFEEQIGVGIWYDF